MFVQPTLGELATTANATVSALGSLGYKCCFFGGFACRLYGSDRVPEDIDVIVVDANANQETIKRQLVAQDSRFYLVEPKTYGATYKVLWFRSSLSRSCKVDVLLPGILSIPNVDQEHIAQLPLRFLVTRTGVTEEHHYPVMPLSVVLLLKLQGWADHRVSLKRYMRMKMFSDVRDINKLLTVASAAGVKPAEESFVPVDLFEAATGRVLTYVRSSPTTASEWRALGFSTTGGIARTRITGPLASHRLSNKTSDIIEELVNQLNI